MRVSCVWGGVLSAAGSVVHSTIKKRRRTEEISMKCNAVLLLNLPSRLVSSWLSYFPIDLPLWLIDALAGACTQDSLYKKLDRTKEPETREKERHKIYIACSSSCPVLSYRQRRPRSCCWDGSPHETFININIGRIVERLPRTSQNRTEWQWVSGVKSSESIKEISRYECN